MSGHADASPAHRSMTAGSILPVLIRLLLSQGRTRAGRAGVLLLAGVAAEGLSLLMLAPLLLLAQGDQQEINLTFPFPGAEAGVITVGIGLTGALACLCALIILQSLLGRARSVSLSSLLGAAVNHVRLQLFEAISRARWSYVSGQRTADLTHLMTADIDRIQTATFSFLMLLQSFAAIAVYTGVSLMISAPMTLFAAGCGAVILLLMQPVRRLATAYGAQLTDRRRQQHRIVSDFLSGMKVAKSFNAEPRYVADLAGALSSSQQDLTRFVGASATATALLQISNAVILAVFVLAAVQWFALPVTELVVLILVYMRLSPRFSAVQASLHELLVNAPALHAVEALREECLRHREEPDGSQAAPAFQQEIRLEGVTYRYGGSGGGVAGVSLTAPARSITALTGGSGAGKSTIADLLMGLVAPEEGSIMIDAVRLDDRNRRAWRNSVAYVPQDTFLLNDTIGANLRLARPAASEEELMDALRAAGAEDLVRRLPEGLHTMAGERGARLSGGERQRIALARAILRRPRLLILDEATSALDADNRALIITSISRLRQDMGVLLITHDPVMLDIADVVVTLESGGVRHIRMPEARPALRPRAPALAGGA